MKNVLVTGGAGFIGSNFIRYLLRVEPEIFIINLDALTYAGRLENLEDVTNQERYRFVRGDICDGDLLKRLLRDHSVDMIVHFAAESHVDRSILGPEVFVQTNIVGTYSLLQAARQYWDSPEASKVEKRFHHISTDEIYGSLGSDDSPFTEQAPYAPNSPYAASKASSDHLVRAYAHTFGLPVTITNCSNNYGSYQFPEKLVPLVILNAMEGKPIPLYGDGGQVRDWLYVEDHCEAIDMVLRKGQPGETYNVGGDTQRSNLALVQQICAILDARFPDSAHSPHERLIEHIADRPGHDRRYAMDITKIHRELGWRPGHTLEAGLEKTVDWYLKQKAWVQAIQQQGDYQDWMAANYARREEER